MLEARRVNGGEHGVVMTKKMVVNAMLDLCEFVETRDLSNVRFLDPAGGDGIFILTALDRLHASSRRHGFDFVRALSNMHAVEIDERRASRLAESVKEKLRNLAGLTHAFPKIVLHADFLAANTPESDVIAGNPPYIRYDNMSTERRNFLRRRFKLFRGRCDMYVVFFERSFELLSSGGLVCLITPDRWLRNQYGEALRDYISANLGVPAILNLDGTNPFEEEVSGYPMISLISQEKGSRTKYTEVHRLEDLGYAVASITAAEVPLNPRVPIKEFPPRKAGLRWTFANEETPHLPEWFRTIEEQGFKIGIGVATGADAVFIGRRLKDLVEAELVLPILLSKDVVDGRIRWSGNFVLNPFDKEGKLVDLDLYPRARQYLTKNRKALEGRHVAQRNQNHWYRTIDRITPDLISKPKLLFPDLTKSRLVALDEGKYYPHHNLYYVIGQSIQDLEVLGALSMSKTFASQLDAQSVKMRGGYARHQAQNIRLIRLPDIRRLPVQTKNELAESFVSKSIPRIETLLRLAMEKEVPPSNH